MSASEHLEHRLRREQADQRLPSIAAAVVRGGETLWAGGAGTVDGHADGTAATAQTQYRIGSITKSMVAITVLRLAEQGLVDLTDPIRTHLPELDASLDRVSVLALLGQSGGLAAETAGPWWERSAGVTWEELLPSIRRVGLPGRRFHYSNVGYAVLGRLVEQLRGRAWHEVLADEVLKPLRMTRTSVSPKGRHAPGLAVHPDAPLLHREPHTETGAMAPAGQLWSTARDLGRWAGFLIVGNEQVLSTRMLREAQQPGMVVDTAGGPWERCYGLGFDVRNTGTRRLVGHGGSMPGFQASVMVDVDEGSGVCLLTNSTAGPSAAVARDLIEVLDTHHPAPVQAWHARTRTDDTVPIADLVGEWYWGPRPYRLRLLGDDLLELGPVGGGPRWSAFERTGADTWVGRDDYWTGETLRLVRSGDAIYLDLGSFRLSRRPYAPDSDIPGGVDADGWGA